MKQLFTFGPNDDLLSELLRQGVRFLVVGGLAVHFYVVERETDDLDILIEPTPVNADRLFSALWVLHLIPEFHKDLISRPSEHSQQIPLKSSYYADLVTVDSDIDFAAEWNRAHEAFIGESPVRIASRELLISMKRKAGREKDLRDVALLESGG